MHVNRFALHRLPTLLFAALLAATAGVPAARAADGADSAAPIPTNLGNAVVKVFATLRLPDPYKPWSKQAPQDISASGVVIEGHRILTNAHAVLYASQVQIQGTGAGDKISATVEAVAPGIDLAVLKLDDDGFFATHAPIVRASALPQIKDAVLAYGFPTGGTSLSITKGIVSRIEYVAYNYPTSGLRIQIDAAINAGNSGGPAIAGERMIGLAFSRLGDAQNIGYIIPNEEIEIFLKDIADGHYDGKPAFFDDLQTLENPALRSYLKLDKSVAGIVVHQPYLDAATYPLKQWDVITRIGDTPVDDQGMVNATPDLRVNFRYLVQKISHDNHVPLTVVRAGRTLDVLAAAGDRAAAAGRGPARGVSAVLHLRTAGVLAGERAVHLVPQQQRRGDGPVRLHGQPAGHRARRHADAGAAGTGGRGLAVLPQPPRRRLFESDRDGGRDGQRHPHPQPRAPGRRAAGSARRARGDRVRGPQRRVTGVSA